MRTGGFFTSISSKIFSPVHSTCTAHGTLANPSALRQYSSGFLGAHHQHWGQDRPSKFIHISTPPHAPVSPGPMSCLPNPLPASHEAQKGVKVYQTWSSWCRGAYNQRTAAPQRPQRKKVTKSLDQDQEGVHWSIALKEPNSTNVLRARKGTILEERSVRRVNHPIPWRNDLEWSSKRRTDGRITVPV